MKKVYALALFVAMALLCVAAESRAAGDKVAMNLDPMRQKLCSGKAADMAEILFHTVEFDLRVEYLMIGDTDKPLNEAIEDARKQINSEMSDFEMNIAECAIATREAITCEQGAKELAPAYQSMYADGKEAGPDAVAGFIAKALGDMGVTQCGKIRLKAAIKENGSSGNVLVDLLVGKIGEAWLPVAELGDVADEQP